MNDYGSNTLLYVDEYNKKIDELITHCETLKLRNVSIKYLLQATEDIKLLNKYGAVLRKKIFDIYEVYALQNEKVRDSFIRR
jgi:uncharacterized metal-binding protein